MERDTAVNKQDVLARIRSAGIIPVLRASSISDAVAIADAVFAGGMDVLEVTMTIPDAASVIRELQRRYPAALIGAGTVMNAESTHACILEGAQFIISPTWNPATLEMCQRHSIAMFPGALTPTEIAEAWQAGGDAIKVFPASAMGGASYLKSLKGPLPQIELIPTGGVSLATAAEFLRAGAYALGVGTDLCDSSAIAEGKPDRITQTARQYLQIIADFRKSQTKAAVGQTRSS